MAFLVALQQAGPLIGERGLLPARSFLERVRSAPGQGPGAFLQVPTLFWLDCSDAALHVASWAGLALSLAVLLGLANVPILAALWLLYMSLVHVGQIFYGYGWEILLLETGFLAVFLVPPLRAAPFPRSTPPSAVVIGLLRWLLFRLMFGAGLIKLRGDSCWRDLTCLAYHYETQPLPNPLSFYLHHLPPAFHALEVLFNHLVELVAPFFLFAPRRLRHVAGLLLVLFQGLLILSGNLSFLNWLTLTICVVCFDDGALGRLLSPTLRARLAERTARAEESKARGMVVYALAVVIAVLSLNPVVNMLSPRQVMNTSYDPLDLVNSYGAFGSILRERNEVVLQGTDDATPGESATWIDYEFKCKPGDAFRRPCVVSPYHHRLDWQMWFAAMTDAGQQPWFLHLVYKLLQGDRPTLGLLAEGPMTRRPPRYIRAVLYRYEFTRAGEKTRAWWRRTPGGEYLRPLSLQDPALLEYVDRQGWRW